MREFKMEDVVYIKERDCVGLVVDIQNQEYYVDFATSYGGACLPFEKEELDEVWCITTGCQDIFNICNDEIYYLGWQNPAWDEDGYFWTAKENIRGVLSNNTSEHPFLFATRIDAIKALKKMHIPQKCRIVKFV